MTVVCCIKSCWENRFNETRSLFKVPKAQNQIGNKWMEVLQGRLKNNLSRENLTVCELHFAPDDIEKGFQATSSEGTLYKISLERPKLRPGAVPTIFRDELNLDSLNVRQVLQADEMWTGLANVVVKTVPTCVELTGIAEADIGKINEITDSRLFGDSRTQSQTQQIEVIQEGPEAKASIVADAPSVLLLWGDGNQTSIAMNEDIKPVIQLDDKSQQWMIVQVQEDTKKDIVPKYTFQHLANDLNTSPGILSNGWVVVFEKNGLLFVNAVQRIPIVAFLDASMQMNVRIMDVSVIDNLKDAIGNFGDFSVYMNQLAMRKACGGMGDMEIRRHEQCEQIVQFSKERCQACQKYRTLEKNKIRRRNANAEICKERTNKTLHNLRRKYSRSVLKNEKLQGELNDIMKKYVALSQQNLKMKERKLSKTM